MSNENKAIVRRLAEIVVQGGNVDALPELLAPEFVVHDLSNPERGGGIEGQRQFVGMLHAGLSDIRYAIEDLIAEGDRVVYRWTLRGIHSGTFMGIPATGEALLISGIDIFRLAESKIVESWVIADSLGMLRQLGVMPAPAGPSAAPHSGIAPSAPTSGTPVSAVPPTKRS